MSADHPAAQDQYDPLSWWWHDCGADHRELPRETLVCDRCGTSRIPSVANTEPLRDEELRDAIGDILDICEGWGRPMTPAEKVKARRGEGDA